MFLFVEVAFEAAIDVCAFEAFEVAAAVGAAALLEPLTFCCKDKEKTGPSSLAAGVAEAMVDMIVATGPLSPE